MALMQPKGVCQPPLTATEEEPPLANQKRSRAGHHTSLKEFNLFPVNVTGTTLFSGQLSKSSSKISIEWSDLLGFNGSTVTLKNHGYPQCPRR